MKKWTVSLALALVRAVDPQRRKSLSSRCLIKRKHLQNNVFWPKPAAVATSCDRAVFPALPLLHYFNSSPKDEREEPAGTLAWKQPATGYRKTLGSVKVFSSTAVRV